jgi:hypothetical protein
VPTSITSYGNKHFEESPKGSSSVISQVQANANTKRIVVPSNNPRFITPMMLCPSPVATGIPALDAEGAVELLAFA